MSNIVEFDGIIESIQQENQNIEANRNERNYKYESCMNQFKEFLKQETKQLEDSEAENNRNKELVSKAFQNTFQRIMNSSDVSLRKIKHTYNEKKQFWGNVIKLNNGLGDIDLKRQFYQQKRSAVEDYEQAIEWQKDRHKPYQVLICKNQKKEQLRDYQQTNKAFEEKVAQGTNTMKEWRNMLSKEQKAVSFPSTNPYQTRTVINQFAARPPLPTYNPKKVVSGFQLEGSTLFLNNFYKKH